VTVDHLYILQMAVTGDLKVGRSKKPFARMKQLQTGAPHRLKLLVVARYQGHRESRVHDRMAKFRLSGGSEWFSVDAFGSIPDNVVELMPPEVMEDPDWWKT